MPNHRAMMDEAIRVLFKKIYGRFLAFPSFSSSSEAIPRHSRRAMSEKTYQKAKRLMILFFFGTLEVIFVVVATAVRRQDWHVPLPHRQLGWLPLRQALWPDQSRW